MSNWRFYGGDLSVVINPPIDTFWVGVPETVAYIGLWCTKDSTGTVTPIGSGFDTLVVDQTRGPSQATREQIKKYLEKL